jgi:DNA-binding NarL/FixJ family response regulator
MRRGRSNRAIARIRERSAGTIAKQVRAIFDKFGVHSRRELFALLGSGAFPLAHPLRSELTEREEQVIHLVGRGLSNKLIAHELGVALGTVGVFISRARAKLKMTQIKNLNLDGGCSVGGRKRRRAEKA